MKNKIEYAQKAISHCKQIKDGINGLCSMIDIANDTFNETDRIGDYKSIFSKVDALEKEYEKFVKENI